LPKVATQWNSGTTRGPRAGIPSALTSKPLSRNSLLYIICPVVSRRASVSVCGLRQLLQHERQPQGSHGRPRQQRRQMRSFQLHSPGGELSVTLHQSTRVRGTPSSATIHHVHVCCPADLTRRSPSDQQTPTDLRSEPSVNREFPGGT